jgi:hypothetical protein
MPNNPHAPNPALDKILHRATAMHAAQREQLSLAESARALDKIDHGEAVTPPDPPADRWPVMDEAAYVGLPGEFVKAVAPYSEADAVGLLLHVLVGGGCLIGPGPHALVEHTQHPARLNVVLVGSTGTGRKGTAWSIPRYLFSCVDIDWTKTRVRSGLSSGEGMIYQVRDADGEDPGEPDKRLLIIEPEFASALTAMERQGNVLSPKIRDAWDHGTLSPMTKRDRLTATGAHIAIIGHISPDELLRSLSATDRANGFANRFLFALVKRSKLIPDGEGAPRSILAPYFTRFTRTLKAARTPHCRRRDRDAAALWAKVYPHLESDLGGLTGAILARGAAQVLRLSLLYSLLDEAEIKQRGPAIRVPHLLAALAVWDYCKSSVVQIFGDALGDAVADRLLRAIKESPQTDTELYAVLGRHDSGRKDPALDLLVRVGRVHAIKVSTAGRPVREWHHGTQEQCALCALRV